MDGTGAPNSSAAPRAAGDGAAADEFRPPGRSALPKAGGQEDVLAAHDGPRAFGPGARRRPPPGDAALVLAPHRPLTRADIPRLCERLDRLLGGAGAAAEPVVVQAGEHCAADLVTVEALARLRLTARRRGRRIRLDGARGELRDLLAWTGLDDGGNPAAPPPEGRLPPPGADAGPEPAGSAGAEARGQAEEREQPGGVQEGVECGDPPA